MSTTTTRADAARPTAAAVDGRSSRWNEHREQRRRELIEATLRAIRRHGASVGMDGIAVEAGTSKTVFYRHFQDRAGLYRAVAERVDQLIMRDVTRAVGPGLEQAATLTQSPRGYLAAAIGSYLRLVEDDPEIYRFIVAAPLLSPGERPPADVAATVTHQIGHQIGQLLEVLLTSVDRDPAPAATWGHAVVGMVRAAADQWLAAGAADSGVSREVLTEQLTDLVWGGLSAAWPFSS